MLIFGFLQEHHFLRTSRMWWKLYLNDYSVFMHIFTTLISRKSLASKKKLISTLASNTSSSLLMWVLVLNLLSRYSNFVIYKIMKIMEWFFWIHQFLNSHTILQQFTHSTLKLQNIHFFFFLKHIIFKKVLLLLNNYTLYIL